MGNMRAALFSCLIACGVSACGEPPQKIDRPVEAARVEPAPVSRPAPEPPKILPPLDVQERWAKDLRALCSANDASLQRASIDITGDKEAERICWRKLDAKPNGEYLDVIALHEDGARTQSAYLLLPVNAGVQDGICMGDSYTVTAEDWSDAEKRENVGIPDDWPELGVTVHGGECDPPYLFWPAGETAEELSFLFARA
jgi:hypothetical protein